MVTAKLLLRTSTCIRKSGLNNSKPTVHKRLWYDTGNTEFKYFDGAAWVGLKAGRWQVSLSRDKLRGNDNLIAMNVNNTYIAT